MIVQLLINNTLYLEHDTSIDVIKNDSNFMKKDDLYILSGRYYGSSTCIGENGWIGYYKLFGTQNGYSFGIQNRPFEIKIEDKKDIEMVIYIKDDNKLNYSSLKLNIPDILVGNTIEVEHDIIKTIYIRKLEKFGNPAPLEISGIAFKY